MTTTAVFCSPESLKRESLKREISQTRLSRVGTHLVEDSVLQIHTYRTAIVAWIEGAIALPFSIDRNSFTSTLPPMGNSEQ